MTGGEHQLRQQRALTCAFYGDYAAFSAHLQWPEQLESHCHYDPRFICPFRCDKGWTRK